MFVVRTRLVQKLLCKYYRHPAICSVQKLLLLCTKGIPISAFPCQLDPARKIRSYRTDNLCTLLTGRKTHHSSKTAGLTRQRPDSAPLPGATAESTWFIRKGECVFRLQSRESALSQIGLCETKARAFRHIITPGWRNAVHDGTISAKMQAR